MSLLLLVELSLYKMMLPVMVGQTEVLLLLLVMVPVLIPIILELGRKLLVHSLDSLLDPIPLPLLTIITVLLLLVLPLISLLFYRYLLFLQLMQHVE